MCAGTEMRHVACLLRKRCLREKRKRWREAGLTDCHEGDAIEWIMMRWIGESGLGKISYTLQRLQPTLISIWRVDRSRFLHRLDSRNLAVIFLPALIKQVRVCESGRIGG